MNAYFIFNKSINADYLHSLFEYDYEYMGQIFESSAKELKDTLAKLPSQFDIIKKEELRRNIHKIKPIFGFVGLIEIQEECLLFEENCKKNTINHELSTQYNTLFGVLHLGLDIIEKESVRLKHFNSEKP